MSPSSIPNLLRSSAEKAVCDGPQSLYPDQFAKLMDELRIIVPAVGRTL